MSIYDTIGPFWDTGRNLIIWEVNGIKNHLGPYSVNGALETVRLLEAYAKRKGQNGFAKIVPCFNVRKSVLEDASV